MGWRKAEKKKKMNVPIEMKTRLDAAERREDRPKTIGQVELNTEIGKKMTFKMCFLKATKIWAMNTASKRCYDLSMENKIERPK